MFLEYHIGCCQHVSNWIHDSVSLGVVKILLVY